jgi:hypothetical protein
MCRGLGLMNSSRGSSGNNVLVMSMEIGRRWLLVVQICTRLRGTAKMKDQSQPFEVLPGCTVEFWDLQIDA